MVIGRLLGGATGGITGTVPVGSQITSSFELMEIDLQTCPLKDRMGAGVWLRAKVGSKKGRMRSCFTVVLLYVVYRDTL
jgi:hypothetical protein